MEKLLISRLSEPNKTDVLPVIKILIWPAGSFERFVRRKKVLMEEQNFSDTEKASFVPYLAKNYALLFWH